MLPQKFAQWSGMADYYPLIARAISGLDASATGEQRRALYERARQALIAQLRGVQPPLSESDITRERLTLEEAIRKVEQEAAQRARARGPRRLRGGGVTRSGADPAVDQPRCARRRARRVRTERSPARARPTAARRATGRRAPSGRGAAAAAAAPAAAVGRAGPSAAADPRTAARAPRRRPFRRKAATPACAVSAT